MFPMLPMLPMSPDSPEVFFFDLVFNIVTDDEPWNDPFRYGRWSGTFLAFLSYHFDAVFGKTLSSLIFFGLLVAWVWKKVVRGMDNP